MKNTPLAAVPFASLLLLLLAIASIARAQTSGTWINASTNSTWSTAANWSGSTVAVGAGATADFSTLDITAARTVNLGTNITIGTIVFGDATTPSNNWTLANGTGGPWALTLATGTGSPVINVVNQTTTISAGLAGSQGFTKTGTGVLTLTGANTVTGGINLSAGTLNFAFGSLGTNTVDFTAGAALGWNASNTQDVSSLIKIEDGVTATLATGANNVTFASPFQAGTTGTGAVTKTGAGTLTLTAANTLTGLTKISAGRLVLSGGNDRLATTGTITLGQAAGSGTLQLGDASSAANQTTTSVLVAGTGTANAVVGGNSGVSLLTINNAAAVAYTGLLGGAGTNENNLALAKSGAGTLTLSNASSTFAGDVQIAGGTLAITKSSALGSTPKTVTISGTTNAPSLKLDGSGGDLLLPSALSFVTSNDNTNTPAILSSAGNNAIEGGIALTTGGFGTGNTRVKVTGGSLILDGLILPAASAAGQVSLILDGSASLNGTVNGLVSDNGAITLALTKAGAGTWTLTSANTYSGATTINAGTLQIASIAATGTAQPLGVASSAVSLGTTGTSGTLEYTGTTAATLTRGITVASTSGGIVKNSGGAVLTLSGTLAKNGRPLTLTGGDIRVTGKITGATAGDLVIDNASVTLSGNLNSYIGSTYVQNGSTLTVSNTSGSATGTGSVTVDATSKLAGSGLINAGSNNLITVNGTLQVGDATASAGTNLELATSGTGTLAIGTSAVVLIDIFSGAGAGDSSANAAAADQLRLSGALDIASGATLKLGNPNHLTAWGDGDVFKVFDWADLSPRNGAFALDASDLNLPSGFTIDTTALYTAGTLRFTAGITVGITPEPSRAALLLAGGLFAAFRRKRPVL